MASLLSDPILANLSPSTHMEALPLLVSVFVVLVPPYEHIGQARLAHPSRTKDHNSGARIPESQKSIKILVVYGSRRSGLSCIIFSYLVLSFLALYYKVSSTLNLLVPV